MKHCRTLAAKACSHPLAKQKKGLQVSDCQDLASDDVACKSQVVIQRAVKPRPMLIFDALPKKAKQHHLQPCLLTRASHRVFADLASLACQLEQYETFFWTIDRTRLDACGFPRACLLQAKLVQDFSRAAKVLAHSAKAKTRDSKGRVAIRKCRSFRT